LEFVQNNSVTEYLKKVEGRLREEQDRCELLLDYSTQTPLGQTLNDVLIKQHLESFQMEFETLLVQKQDEDLGRYGGLSTTMIYLSMTFIECSSCASVSPAPWISCGTPWRAM